LLSGPAHRMDRRSAGRLRGFAEGQSAAIEADADVILFGTAAEASVSTAISARCVELPLISQGKPQLPICPRCSRSVISSSGNDSGAMHVAAAVGLPVIAVFGPTDPEGQLPSPPRCNHRSAKVLLQPMFSPPLPDRSPVHDRNHGPTWWRPRQDHGCTRPGAAC